MPASSATGGGRRIRGTVVALVLTVATTLVTPGADAREDLGAIDDLGALAETVLFEDGDFVVLAADDDEDQLAAAKSGSGSDPATVSRGGFITYGDLDLLPRYEVRLVRSTGIETVRGVLTAASATVSSVGIGVGVRSGQVERQSPGLGQIDVVVSRSSLCSGSWLACGGPVVENGTIVAGRVWVNPRLLARPRAQIENTMRHELAHTIGLAHYDGLHDGRIQVMHSTRFDAVDYRSGDRNGLAWMAGHRGAEVHLDSVSYAAGAYRASGTLPGLPGDAALFLRVGDDRQRIDHAEGRFSGTIPSGPGSHRVCAEVMRDREVLAADCRAGLAPSAPIGILDAVHPGTLSVRADGWGIDPQTAEAILVRVSVDGVVLSVIADEPRPDVAAAYPRYGERHGFAAVRTVAPGPHEVCVSIRDEETSEIVRLGCRTVVVRGHGPLGQRPA